MINKKESSNIKDCSENTINVLIKHIQLNFGIIFKKEHIVGIFSDEEFNSWDYIKDINPETMTARSFDTADRETIYEHLWVRLMGYPTPNSFDGTDVIEELLKVINNPCYKGNQWKGYLYNRNDVYEFHHKHLKKRVRFEKTNFIDIDGDPEFVARVQKLLDESSII